MLAAVSFNAASAQNGLFSGTDRISAGGSIGLTASAYAVDGIENRRPPGMIQSTANLNFSLFGLSSGLNMFYSTDDSGFRQNMNAFRYNASWKWVTVQVGDINSRFSQYGLNGATVRGGYVKLNPGKFLFEAVGGRSQRAVKPSVETGFREPSFEQWAYGTKIGYGSGSGSYFHLSTFYAIDSRDLDDTNGVLEINPQENLTVTPDFQVQFFDGRFTLASQVTTSIFTRDINSEYIPYNEIPLPSFFENIFKPRSSSRINFAGLADATLTLDMFNMTLGYERVQPGFESLGRGRSRDDFEKVSVNPVVRLLGNRLNINSSFSYGRDNLLGNRLQTQNNINAGTSIQMQVTDRFTLSTTYNLLLIDVNPASGSEDIIGGSQTQSSHNVLLQPGYSILSGSYSHNITLNAGYLSIDSQFGGNQQGVSDFSSYSLTGGLNYSVSLPNGLTLTSSGNYLTNSSDGLEIDNFGVNLGSSYSLFSRSLTLSANAGINFNNTQRELPAGDSVTAKLQQITGSLNAQYRLTARDSFSLRLRTRTNRSTSGAGREFSELEGSFQYQRSF
ncbi:hypothetical protein DDZ15_05075 [Rhodohalobacter mucosus]|uniref:Uncharacterized protein n=1 Tax=Rhodohalobacter mucosus TaxID=2079485 RepID=A0A316TT89_9BACT|nr:hypothetical protein DDZ15_05075 [Rhodohalobacter mucosus]